ncbi:MAG: transcriptional repressor, partial [Oscillospiraceae bacterium]|nr:transcriptional repressor [Oscillospiraceae bacterium]
MATYITKQQKAVLTCIASHREQCVTAAELVEELRSSGEQVGLATVYRQLEKLERQGHVHK